MATKYQNRLQTTVSAVASAGLGAFTISAASSGYISFVAGDDGLSFDISVVEGTAWEIRTSCVYTHSGTSLARGTLESSSTGSAIAFTAAAIVTATPSASNVNRWNAAALEQVTGTDASTTMAVNNLYVVDMSAWATADRTYTLPTTAAVGDRVGVLVTAGNASYELLITAATSDTLNGVAGGTEWSRLFITNEVVIMRCIVANTTWIVEQDGRIPCVMALALTTAVTTGDTGGTYFTPTSLSGVWTADTNIGSAGSTSTGRFTARRAGTYNIFGITSSYSSTATDKYVTGRVWNGTSTYVDTHTVPGISTTLRLAYTALTALAVGVYAEYQHRNEVSNIGAGTQTRFAVMEVLL